MSDPQQAAEERHEWEQAVAKAESMRQRLFEGELAQELKRLHTFLALKLSEIDPYENEEEYRRMRALADLAREWVNEAGRIVHRGAVAITKIDEQDKEQGREQAETNTDPR